MSREQFPRTHECSERERKARAIRIGAVVVAASIATGVGYHMLSPGGVVHEAFLHPESQNSSLEERNLETLQRANESIDPRDLYEVDVTNVAAHSPGEEFFLNAQIAIDDQGMIHHTERDRNEIWQHAPFITVDLETTEGARSEELSHTLPVLDGQSELMWRGRTLEATVTNPSGETIPTLVYESDYNFTEETARPRPDGRSAVAELGTGSVIIPLLDGHQEAGQYTVTLDQSIYTGLTGFDPETFHNDIHTNRHANDFAMITVEVAEDGSATIVNLSEQK